MDAAVYTSDILDLYKFLITLGKNPTSSLINFPDCEVYISRPFSLGYSILDLPRFSTPFVH